jgi:hypothetical protein
LITKQVAIKEVSESMKISPCRQTVTRAVFFTVLAIAVPTRGLGDPAEAARLRSQATEAASQLRQVCSQAWKYDNLRPTTRRAVAPLGGIFNPAPEPVIHLSPGSPDYRYIVGEMAYWYSLCSAKASRAILADKTAAPGGVARLAKIKAVDDSIVEELRYTGDAADILKASYCQACAQAWPYVNLRPRCKEPGFEAATILNPFLPVPTIKLSEAGQDYQEITSALDELEPRFANAAGRFGDLQADRSALAEVAAAKAPPDNAADDPRLATMLEMLKKLQPAVREWRKLQRSIEELYEPWRTAYKLVAQLYTEYLRLQAALQVALVQQNDQDPNVRADGLAREIDLRRQSAILLPQLEKARKDLAQIVSEISKHRHDQAAVAQEGSVSVDDWARVCDTFCRLGPESHRKALPHFHQWVAEEPRLWHPYFARGIARLHTGDQAGAVEDLKRVEDKVRIYGGDPNVVAVVAAIRAYALCKGKSPLEGEKLFVAVQKQAPKLWAVYLIRGWSNLERAKYPIAKENFRLALFHSEERPRPEAQEAMALLFAACPVDTFRNGGEALKHAVQAQGLAGGDQGWIYLNTLGAAQAEAGDFKSAIDSATKAAESAPADSQEHVTERIKLYQGARPYRLR